MSHNDHRYYELMSHQADEARTPHSSYQTYQKKQTAGFFTCLGVCVGAAALGVAAPVVAPFAIFAGCVARDLTH